MDLSENLFAPSGPPKLKIVDGWVMDENDKLLIWVPDEYRASLWCPGMLLLVGCEPIEIDFAKACYGTEWASIKS